MTHIPIRTCVGCLRRRPKGELLRFVISKEAIKTGKASGRGFYLCPNRDCFQMAMRRRGFVKEILRVVSKSEFEKIFLTSLENMIDCGGGLGVISSLDRGGVTLG